MISQLLWVEFVLKLAAGAVLVLAPRATIKAFGLPAASGTVPFWPRVAGVLLVAIAGASFLQGWLGRSNGLGLAGSALINASLAAMLFITLGLRGGSLMRRGRILFWLLGILLATASVIEIAYAEVPRLP